MAGRKPAFVAGPPRHTSLGGGDSDTGEGRTNAREQTGETSSKRLRTDGNGEGDEDDEHGIFGGGGTTLVTAKATGQTEHLKFLLQGADPVAVGAKSDHIATQPMTR